MLSLPGATIAVDASCSGVKLLYSGVLFGLLAAPLVNRGLQRLLFWSALLVALLGANVVRVTSLAVGQLLLGQPLGEAAHQSVGLVAFALVCLLCLALVRGLSGPAAGEAPCSPRCSGALPRGVPSRSSP